MSIDEWKEVIDTVQLPSLDIYMATRDNIPTNALEYLIEVGDDRAKIICHIPHFSRTQKMIETVERFDNEAFFKCLNKANLFCGPADELDIYTKKISPKETIKCIDIVSHDEFDTNHLEPHQFVFIVYNNIWCIDRQILESMFSDVDQWLWPCVSGSQPNEWMPAPTYGSGEYKRPDYNLFKPLTKLVDVHVPANQIRAVLEGTDRFFIVRETNQKYNRTCDGIQFTSRQDNFSRMHCQNESDFKIYNIKHLRKDNFGTINQMRQLYYGKRARSEGRNVHSSTQSLFKSASQKTLHAKSPTRAKSPTTRTKSPTRAKGHN